MDKSITKKLKLFFGKFPQMTFQKGELLIRTEENPQGIFYLSSGSIRQYALSESGEEITINLYKPVCFFPMTWAINSITNHYYFEAMTDSLVHMAPKIEVVQFIKQNPDVLYNLLKRILSGLDSLLLRMEYLMAGNAYKRLIIILLISAKRFGEKSLSPSGIKLQMIQKEIANQAGISRETVCREMQKLKKKGLIHFVGNTIIIADMNKLEEEFGPTAPSHSPLNRGKASELSQL